MGYYDIAPLEMVGVYVKGKVKLYVLLSNMTRSHSKDVFSYESMLSPAIR